MLRKENLMRMAEIRGEWCVSVYMPIGAAEAKEKRRRLKKLMLDAEVKLHNLQVESFKIARLLGPVEMILDSPGFWENQTKGIAAFFTPESFAWYSLEYSFNELVVVTDRFHLKPLLHDASENGRFYLLALGKDQIKLYEASELGINEIYVKGIPRNLACFFNPGTEENSSEEENKDCKDRLLDLFQRVEKAVTGHLKNDDAPLVLAGDEQMHPVYHDVNSYPHLVKIGIGKGADKVTPKQLLEKALPIVKPVFQRRRKTALRNFREKIACGQASNNLSKILTAAKTGRVETLFVPVGKQKWGTFDGSAEDITVHREHKPGDKDLLCVASTRTLRTGGEVFVLAPENMPDNSVIAAVLRN